MKNHISKLGAAIPEAAKYLRNNDALRMAGATAFFTTFALPPMVIIIVRVFGLFLDKRRVGRHVMGKVGNVIGEDGKGQILEVIRSVRGYQFTPLATALIFLFLLFVATTLFIVIKGSINQLWNVRPAHRGNIKSILIARARAFGIILFTGVLFLAVMAFDWLREYFNDLPQLGVYVSQLVNELVSIVVVIIWFFALFRYLPDGQYTMRVTLVGAIATGLLFSFGKVALHWLLSGNIKDVYGTSGALVLILLFVFYSSLMLYFGVAFTKAWARQYDIDVTPAEHAVRYHLQKEEAVATT